MGIATVATAEDPRIRDVFGEQVSELVDTAFISLGFFALSINSMNSDETWKQMG